MMRTSQEAVPWSLILPQLEKRAKRDAAEALLLVWQETAFHGTPEGSPLIHFCENGYFHARQHAIHAAEALRALIGADQAAALVQSAQEAAGELSHDVWRLYLFFGGVARFGFVERPEPDSAIWQRRVRGEGIWTSWDAECMMEAGRTGTLAPPAEDSPIWREGCQ